MTALSFWGTSQEMEDKLQTLMYREDNSRSGEKKTPLSVNELHDYSNSY